MSTFLDRLNPTQREAATFGEGPLLIIAGAGSGKTSVLTSRIAYLILEKGVDPESILAVTFTNKAAGEMRRRLSALIGQRSHGLWLGTFHSLGLRIIRGALDGARSLTVYDDSDQLTLIKQIMTELKIPEKSFSPRGVLTRISQAKNEEIGPEEYATSARDFFSGRVAKVYSEYQKRLRAMDAMDFGDLIVEPIKLLKKNKTLLDQYTRRQPTSTSRRRRCFRDASRQRSPPRFYSAWHPRRGSKATALTEACGSCRPAERSSS